MGYFISTIKQSACAPCLTASCIHTLGFLTSRLPHLFCIPDSSPCRTLPNREDANGTAYGNGHMEKVTCWHRESLSHHTVVAWEPAEVMLFE